MNLANYLTETKQSPTDFSEKSGIPYATIYSYLSSNRKPTIEVAYHIYVTTNEMVNPFDFLSAEEKKAINARIKAVSKSSHQRN